MSPEPLSDLDLIELSDRAWEIIDPVGDHEVQEQLWTALIGRGWPPLPTLDDVRAHLEALLETLSPPPPAVPLRAVAAVIVFLAAHPARRDIGDGLLADALHEAFGAEPPDDVTAWLASRRRSPAPHRRRHGAAHPRRADTRPSAAETEQVD